MSTKPSVPATWDSTSTNLISPTAGHKTSGFAVNEVPSSSEINGQLKLIGDWTTYVDDGDVILNSVIIDGELEVTLAGTYTPVYTFAAQNYRGIHISPTANVVFDGMTAGVRGRELYIWNLGGVGYTVTLKNQASGATATNFNNRITDLVLAPGGIAWLRYTNEPGENPTWTVIGSASSVSVQTINANGAGIVQNWAPGGGYIASSAGAQAIAHLPINLPVGATINSYIVYGNKTSGAGIALTTQLGELNGTTGALTANTTPGTGTETTSAASPGAVTLTKTGLSYNVTSGKSWVILLYNSASSAGERIYHAEVTYFIPR